MKLLIKILVIAISLMNLSDLNAQNSNSSTSDSLEDASKELIRKACSETGMFIYQTPVRFKLDMGDTLTYLQSLNDYSGIKLDKSVLIELIVNSTYVDSSAWGDSDPNGKVIIVDRKSNLDLSKWARYQSIIDFSQIIKYNNTMPSERYIDYLSKPVFTKDRKYALIEFDHPNGSLGGEGFIKLYYLAPTGWNEIGLLNQWRY